MGGYVHYDRIDVGYPKPQTIISDSLKKEFNDMPEDRKEKVINLLQAKIRLLEQKWIADVNMYETQQAEEDRKFFLHYRKPTKLEREVLMNASDNIDEVLPYKPVEDTIKRNIFDRSAAFDSLFGLKTDTVCMGHDDDLYESLDMTPVEPLPTKVTLVEQLNKELDQLTMPVERMGNVCIVVNKRTHNIVYSNETEDTVTITFERK